jgi:uncharacterized protein YdiU (UPF0061 family)
MVFNFDNSYLHLPQSLYSLVNPTPVKNPFLLCFNNQLANNLGITIEDEKALTTLLSGNEIPQNTTPFAQAYAGHQFGHFNRLGDGRAILLGEHVFGNNRVDIQLKGPGITPYSRRGDGRATLSSMLREYVISEAMYFLNIPTTRILAVVSTGEMVYREKPQYGGILTRVAQSHIRVGTFEYAGRLADKECLRQLTNYTIQRHYPEIDLKGNYALEFLQKVADKQLDLIVDWLRVGFIHGVMNTDNMSIAGETIDYGPCAFMNRYHPKTVFSSIDENGRYAFDNQINMALWNLTRFAEMLLSLIHEDNQIAIQLATKVLEEFPDKYHQKFNAMMGKKLGIKDVNEEDILKIHELLLWMENKEADYTLTFIYLSHPHLVNDTIYQDSFFENWKNWWQQRVGDIQKAKEVMQQNNPFIIPRNHIVEQILRDVSQNQSLTEWNNLLQLLQNPYTAPEKFTKEYLQPDKNTDYNHTTYCGT